MSSGKYILRITIHDSEDGVGHYGEPKDPLAATVFAIRKSILGPVWRLLAKVFP